MVDGLSSQNFHFSLDTTTIHVNVADTPVADTAEATEPAAMDASEGTADAATDTAPSELATPPASYWSLAHVVADTLAATANVNDAEAPAVTDPHAEQPAAASVSVDDGQLADGAVSSPYHAAQEVLAPESVEGEATSPDTAAPEAAAPSLVNLALHHYGAVDTLAASDSAASV